MSEWRDIWEKLINASRETLLKKDTSFKLFTELEKTYPNDKMILLEKGITYECLLETDKAKRLYSKAADSENGLPVQHWRDRADYYLKRIELYDCTVDTKIEPDQDYFSVQWDTYFNIHAYYNLDSYIRYLAISSVSRIDSEPAMAIVIFRTCLEIGLWTYYDQTEEINEQLPPEHRKHNITLSSLISKLKLSHEERNAYFDIVEYGNEAAHPKNMNLDSKPYTYKDDELKTILISFNEALRYLDKAAKKYHKRH